MLSLSRNLKLFSVLMTIYSIVFQNYYNQFLNEENWNYVILCAAGLFVTSFATGLILGWKDPLRNHRNDLGFLYHLMTYITVNAVAVVWFLAGLSSDKVTPVMIIMMVISWGVGLLVHHLISRKTIKGMTKTEAFP